jgi:N-acetylglucosamine-6-phosphate deacetylase
MKAPRGVIDLHVHGMGRFDTRSAKASDILNLAALCGRDGVSAIVPAIYPAPIDVMRQALSAIREAMEVRPLKGSAHILGAHLEGPFVNPGRAGALDSESFMSPTIPNLKKLIAGFEDAVRIITIAPEMKGALRIIGRCTEMGIKVNMGHSDATFAQAREGKRAGATGITHLFNAMRPFHHREPGLAGFGLTDRDIYVELIADGVHVHPEVLKMLFDLKPPERILLVSDAVRGPQYRKGVLQGAKAPVTQAAKALRQAGVSARAVRLAMKDNPARYLALDKEAA